MNLDRYLARHGGSLRGLTRSIKDQLGDRTGTVCYLAGSLIEGIGNTRSDIDVYAIADGSPRHATFADVVIGDYKGVTLDIEFVASATIERLLDRLSQYPPDALRDHRVSATAFSFGELKVLHNLAIGHPILSESEFEELRQRCDEVALARVNFDRHQAYLGVLQDDALGFLEQGQLDAARCILRQMRSHLTGLLLAANGNTNPAEKWHFAALKRLGKSKKARILPHLATVDVIDELRALDKAIGSQDPFMTFRRINHLSLALVPWGLRQFCDQAASASTSAACGRRPRAAGCKRSDGRKLPPLTLDAMAGYDDGGIWISKLAHPKRLYLNPLAHELLLSFDGQTCVDEARKRLNQSQSDDACELAQSVEAFERVLRQHELI